MQLFPIYNEKAQAGLRISDDNNRTLYSASYPRDAYANFDSIPPLLVNSLLFVENRHLMDENGKTWNPAIEWPRFTGALMGYGLKKIGIHGDQGGGSTLATQIEKFRHSPEGITSTGKDKLSQMLTASVRAYDTDGKSVEGRRRIVLDYLNSMPLSSYPGFGEVNGYADGISLWFGTRFEDANKLMRRPESELNDTEMKDLARVYRESLSLVMAVKKPSAYLLKDRHELEDRIDKFLPLMVEAKIISPRLAQLVLSERVEYATPIAAAAHSGPMVQKSAQALRIDLLETMGMKNMYDLTRLDLTARTTVDVTADKAVSATLRSLADTDNAVAAGLTGFQLLKPEQAGNVIYSFTLYEKTPTGNVLRVQADNFNGPLNLNEGTKLELGSTAKLRTLVSYLEAVSDLREKYKDTPVEELKAHHVNANDHITRWAIDYLTDPATDKSLNAMLEASLNRTYSGSPGEAFFTGGGMHRFENFERKEDFQNYTVKDAFHHSVNLSFIRIMRDLVYYTQGEKMHVDGSIYDDPNDPKRIEYLTKFADAEGQGFMWKFWKEQKGKSPEELADLLAAKTSHHSPVQLAVVYRSLFPDAPYEKFAAFIEKNCPTAKPGDDFHKQYDAYGKDKFNLNDRGYLTHIHPLQLWMAQNAIATPAATWDETVAQSKDVRTEVYKWLLNPHKMHGQNIRIQTMLEKEAFGYIHDTWAAKGYPFGAMVPSYASALGASGDTPFALAEFSGIMQNDGIYKKSIKFRDITFGENTPYELHFDAKQPEGHRVLPAELTALVRREMQGVVNEGTAHRAFESVKLSDGRILPVGGKTGTGDNRLQTFSAGGALKSSDAKSRTATFVYGIDDRFYGCVTAYVMGAEAKDYKFTSALAAQVFKNVVPGIRPVLDRAYGVENKPEVAQDNTAKKPDVKKPAPPKAAG